VSIGKNAYFNCTGGVEIGEHTIMSRDVVIYSYDHNFQESTLLPFDDGVIERPVVIGKYVWIGMRVTIAPGTEIGDGAIIGIGCVVSGHVPPNAIVVSAKTRIVGARDDEKTKYLAANGDFI